LGEKTDYPVALSRRFAARLPGCVRAGRGYPSGKSGGGVAEAEKRVMSRGGIGRADSDYLPPVSVCGDCGGMHFHGLQDI